jgi:Outer membrane phospholipase A
METLKIRKAFKIILICMFFLLFLSFPSRAAEIADRVAECAKIKDDATARLACFDNLAKQQTAVKDTSPPSIVAVAVPQESSTKEKKQASVMSQHWDLGGEKGKSVFYILRPYRPNYFLPVAYNSSPNEDTALDFDPRSKAQHDEAKFQLSFKVKIWGDLLKDTLKDVFKKDIGIDIWVAYTQLSFWQLYNSAFSAPFRETDYEPELLINFRTDYAIPGFDNFKIRYFNLGLNHDSNGRSRPLSRGWNRVVANVGMEKDNFNLLLKTWYRIPEDEHNDDNPDITRYMGYGELWGIYYWRGQRFAAMLRNNLRSENLGAVQLDWSIPLSFISDNFKNISFYIQYFNGYGESLIDYNTSINRISAGLMLVDWN